MISVGFLGTLSGAARDIVETLIQESDAYTMILQTCDLYTHALPGLPTQFITDLSKRYRYPDTDIHIYNFTLNNIQFYKLYKVYKYKVL